MMGVPGWIEQGLGNARRRDSLETVRKAAEVLSAGEVEWLRSLLAAHPGSTTEQLIEIIDALPIGEQAPINRALGKLRAEIRRLEAGTPRGDS